MHEDKCLKFHAQNYLHFKNISRSKKCLIFIFALGFAATSKKTQDSEKYILQKRAPNERSQEAADFTHVCKV